MPGGVQGASVITARPAIDTRRRTHILKCMLNYSDTGLDRAFHALADPARRRMVDQLCRGPASVSTLAAPLKMSLPAVVQHLQVLEESGLVRSEKTGRVRTCRIEPKALRVAERWINERRTLWEQRLDRLEAFLDEEDSSRRRRK